MKEEKKTTEYIAILLALLAIAVALIGHKTKTFINIGLHPTVTDVTEFSSLVIFPKGTTILFSSIGILLGIIYSIKHKKKSIGLILNAAILILITISIYTGIY